MNTSTSLRQKTLVTVALGLVTSFGGVLNVAAAPLSLSKVPLYTNESVEPNFALTFDDSGSMLRGFVPDALSSGTTRVPGFDENNDGALDVIDTRCWWRDRPWLAYSANVNKIYYNPSIDYLPPKKANGDSMPDASFTGAWEDGIQNNMGIATSLNIPGGTSTRNLSNAYRITWELGYSSTYTGNAIYRPGMIQYGANNSTSCEPDEGNTADDIGFFKFPTGAAKAFYYKLKASPNMSLANPLFHEDNYEWVDVTTASAAQKTNFANWYSYYRTRSLLARSSLSRVFDAQQNLRVVWQGLNANTLDNTKEISSISGGSAQRTKLFEFIFKNPAKNGTPNIAATNRVGTYFGGTNTGNDNSNPYYDATANRELSCRQNFHLLVTDGAWNTSTFASNTDAGTLTLPDAKTYPSGAHTAIYSRGVDNSGGLADAALFYWGTDLRTDLTNNVPAYYEDLTMGVTGAAGVLGSGELPSSQPEIYWNPVNDPATWQHLVQYIVGFGIGGDIPFPGAYNALRRSTYPVGWNSWGAVGDDIPGKVDDTWHAAINSRGEFFSVSNPSELVSSLNNVFTSVGKRSGSNTPLSLSSGLLTTNTLGYQTSFDTSDWSGGLIASKFATTPPTANWDAACILTGGTCLGGLPAQTGRSESTRLIATRNDVTALGVPFRFASLSTAQQAELSKNPKTNLADGLGTKRVSYIRGSRVDEAQSGGPFRNRKNLMGAVVNSTPLLPREQDFYRDETSFEADSSERANPYSVFAEDLEDYDTVFVGANDGMLHAFDSGLYKDGVTGGGTERWAYVPGTVVKNLNKLTSATELQFQSYVDATPQTRDVFIGGEWRRVLVGGLRLGGQGVYALDITNPVANNEGAVAAKVLWEFSDKSSGGANLGYTYGTPYITRLANRKWVALVPGGYNSEEADGSVGSGTASLFVLDMANGAVIHEFNLGVGSRGLSSVNAGDYRVDGVGHDRDVTDVAFAGDLNGNIWRFNLEGTTTGTWTADKFFTADAGQAITVLPRLVRTAYEDVPGTGGVKRKFVVTFGTGKYIENSDRAVGVQQAYYGIYDQGPGSTTITKAQLHKQTLTEQGSGATLARKLTSTQVPSTKKGWYFDFVSPGERNIAAASVRNISGSLIFTTLVPLSTNPCQPAADSWLIFADATTGGVPGTGAAGQDTNNDGVPDSTNSGLLAPTFDTNASGNIDSADDKDVVGIKLKGYEAGVTPATQVGGGQGQILLPGGERIIIPDYSWRRRSWREIVN